MLLVLLTLTACERSEFDDARKLNTIQAYDQFLSEHPTGDLAQQAKELREDVFRNNSITERTIDAYDKYLNEYPEGRYVSEMEALKDGLSFHMAVSNDTIESFKDYISRFPKGRHLNKAQATYDKLVLIDALKKEIDSEHDAKKKEVLNQKLNKLYWDKTDDLSLHSLEILVKNDVNKKLTDKALARAKVVADSLAEISVGKIEINQATNNFNKRLSFTLPVHAKVFYYMTGEKVDSDGFSGALKGNTWLDFGALENMSIKGRYPIRTNSLPAGGELTNRLIAKVIELSPGEHRLTYKTDGGRAWGDFNESPPLYQHWGVSIYFLDIDEGILDDLKFAADVSKDPNRTTLYLALAGKISDFIKRSAQDKKMVVDAIGSERIQLSDIADIDQLTDFIKNNHNNIWLPIVEHAVRLKRVVQASRDLYFSTVNVSQGRVTPEKLGWFAKAAKAEGVAGSYDSAEAAQSSILSGNGEYFSSVKGKQYYFTGYVENKSNKKTYNVDLRCDFNFESVTTAGIWWLRSTTVSHSLRSTHYRVMNLEPGERRAYACKMGGGSGSAVNIGIIGGSSSNYVNEWRIGYSLISESTRISDETMKGQEALLVESGVSEVDISKADKLKETHPMDLNINEERGVLML